MHTLSTQIVCMYYVISAQGYSVTVARAGFSIGGTPQAI